MAAPRDYSFWDYDSVLQRANGDEKFLLSLVQDLTEQTRSQLAQIDSLLEMLQAHVSADALSEICTRTQQLKGIYELLCCSDLLAASSAMHTFASAAVMNDCGPASSEICDTLCTMRNALAAAADVMLRELASDGAGCADQAAEGVNQQMSPKKQCHSAEFPFLNYTAVLEACGGDQGFALQLLKELPGSARSELDMIDSYIEGINQEVRWELSDGSSDSGTGNTERNNTHRLLRNLLETVHKLKGAFQTLFCTEMYNACLQFHQAVKQAIEEGPKDVSEVYAELLLHRGRLGKACEVMFEYDRHHPLETRRVITL